MNTNAKIIIIIENNRFYKYTGYGQSSKNYGHIMWLSKFIKHILLPTYHMQ